jgi:membrane protein implicated in regulation of membrane protease activity
MDIISILKNKFVLSLILSIVLLLCYYQFDKIKSKTDEEEQNSEERNMIFYFKYLVLFYIVSFVLVLAVSKGYEYYNKNNIQLFNSLVNKTTENNKLEEDNLNKVKLLEERKQKLLELKKQEQVKKAEQEKKTTENKIQKGGEEPSFTIETIDETVKSPEKKSEQNFNMGNPSF